MYVGLYTRAHAHTRGNPPACCVVGIPRRPPHAAILLNKPMCHFALHLLLSLPLCSHASIKELTGNDGASLSAELARTPGLAIQGNMVSFKK